MGCYSAQSYLHVASETLHLWMQIATEQQGRVQHFLFSEFCLLDSCPSGLHKKLLLEHSGKQILTWLNPVWWWWWWVLTSYTMTVLLVCLLSFSMSADVLGWMKTHWLTDAWITLPAISREWKTRNLFCISAGQIQIINFSFVVVLAIIIVETWDMTASWLCFKVLYLLP